jgi:putative endonuclease
MKSGAVCAVYILTNQSNTVLYTGVTTDLKKRMWEHRQKIDPRSFSARYNLVKLVYFEAGTDIRAAIFREKQIKNWHRGWKMALIEKTNPGWRDLSADWVC